MGQRAKIKWLKEGDKNTIFFHAITNYKRRRGKVHIIQAADGKWVFEQHEISEADIQFFQKQFSSEATAIDFDLVDRYIPCLITESMNIDLTKCPVEEEVIYQTIRDMDPKSAAGSDGFGGKFYVLCLPIIKVDLIQAVIALFCGRTLPKVWTSTLIVAIPKVENPKGFNEMRPISLYNFCNNVIAKIVTSILAPILPQIISGE